MGRGGSYNESVTTLAVVALATAAGGCGRLQFEQVTGAVADASSDVALIDADRPPPCDPSADFGTPALIDELSSATDLDGTLRLLPDELSGYYWRGTPPDQDVFYASRPSFSAPFTVTAVTGINSPTSNELDPTLADDGVMVFRRNTPGDELYVATRVTPDSFTAPIILSLVNSSSSDGQSFMPTGRSELYFQSKRTQAGDLYFSTRTGTQFTAPVRIDELATTDEEGDPVVTADGLEIYYRTNRAAPLTGFNIVKATRTTPTGTFGLAMLVPNINTSADDGPSWISPDGCRLYISSAIRGTNDIYVATRGL